MTEQGFFDAGSFVSRKGAGEPQEDILNIPPVSKILASSVEETARSAFLAWEKLRIVYNVALTGVVLLSAGSAFSRERFWSFLVEAALLANVCFCLGPVAEGYLTLLGCNRQGVRLVVFLLGTIVGCFLAFLTVFLWYFPGMD